MWRLVDADATLTGHTLRVRYLAMSPDGQTIVTGAGDETLRFWNVFPGPKQGSASDTSSMLDFRGGPPSDDDFGGLADSLDCAMRPLAQTDRDSSVAWAGRSDRPRTSASADVSSGDGPGTVVAEAAPPSK